MLCPVKLWKFKISGCEIKIQMLIGCIVPSGHFSSIWLANPFKQSILMRTTWYYPTSYTMSWICIGCGFKRSGPLVASTLEFFENWLDKLSTYAIILVAKWIRTPISHSYFLQSQSTRLRKQKLDHCATFEHLVPKDLKLGSPIVSFWCACMFINIFCVLYCSFTGFLLLPSLLVAHALFCVNC